MKKAQIWSLDFVISVVIFMIVVIALIFSLNYTSVQTTEHISINQMGKTALFISDSIIRSKGIPEDWNTSNVKIVGLAEKENVLNETKVRYFLNLSEQKIKETLGIESYNFYVELKDIAGQTVQINGDPAIKGSYPSNANFVVPVERTVLFNEKISKFIFILWF
jgi:hypothetical protein